MRDIESLVGLAVDQQSLHIAATIAHALGPHLYGTAVGQGQPQVGQIGRAQHVLVRARTDGIEAEGREDVPSGHLAAIVVATQPADVGTIHAVHDGAHPLLRLPRLGGPGVEVGDVVAGLVAVHVAAHEAVGRNVFVVLVVAFGQVHLKEAVQSLAEYGFAAHCLHHSAHIVGHVEGEIPSVALNESLAIRLVGVHIGLEASVGIARAGKTACGIVHIAIRLRPLGKGSRGGRIAGGLCRGIDGPVVVGVFQGIGGRCLVAVEGYVAHCQIVLHARHSLATGRADHRT